MQTSLLVVDDDPDMCSMFREFFRTTGFALFSATSGETGLRLAREKLPSVMLLDVNLPQISGIEVCQALKRDPRVSSIPILMITSDHKEGQESICLELGADDYLCKPLERSLLLAHVHALLRRGTYTGTNLGVLETGSLRMDLMKKVVVLEQKSYAHLTPKEFDLLYCLAKSDNRVPRDVLYQKVWGLAAVERSMLRTVEVHIQRLRSKLGLDRENGIVSVSGRGYQWLFRSKLGKEVS